MYVHSTNVRPRGNHTLGLFMVSIFVGTVLALLYVASQKRDAVPAPVGPIQPTNSAGQATNRVVATETGSAHDHSDPNHVHENPDMASGTKPPPPTVRIDAPTARAQALEQQKKLQAGGNQGQPMAMDQGAPVSVVLEVLGGNALEAGKPFSLQVTLDQLADPLTSYSLDLRWNPQMLEVTGVEGVKGGFAAPSSTQDGSSLKLTASDAPFPTGRVPVAILKGTVKGSAGSARVYVTPTTITTTAPGQAPVSKAGIPQAVAVPVQ